jgi:hypothetical protein
MDWERVWDIRNAGSTDVLSGLGLGVVVLLVAIGLVWNDRRRQRRPVLGTFLAIMALVWSLAVAVTQWDRQRLAALLERGEVQTVEGFVSGHQVWRQERARSPGETQRYNTWETITVGTVQFTWALDAAEAAFTNAGEGKVAFRDGMPARVHWVEDVPGEAHQRRIVMLEIPAGFREGAALQAPYPSMVDPATLVPAAPAGEGAPGQQR